MGKIFFKSGGAAFAAAAAVAEGGQRVKLGRTSAGVWYIDNGGAA